MPFTPDEIADTFNSTLDTFIDRGKVWKQDLQNKPMLDAFQAGAGQFTGGKENVSFAVGSGRGGAALAGYSGDDELSHSNPVGTKRVYFPWKEHYIGHVITMTELKQDGIDVIESGSDQSTREMSDREMQALANKFDEKNEKLAEDYNYSLDLLLHGDGSTDVKALAGIRAFILDNPNAGSTGGLSRVANTWWRNRAATAAFQAAGGQGPITVNTADGGALIEFMDKEARARSKFRKGQTRTRYFAGSDFIDGYKKELRANGYYSNTGWNGQSNADGAMPDPKHAGIQLEWDPTLDDLGLSKRCYALDMGKGGVRLLYMDGQRRKKHNPARPYNRLVIYSGISMTGLLVAKQLNTSGVYDMRVRRWPTEAANCRRLFSAILLGEEKMSTNSFAVAKTVLTTAVANGATFTVGYPSGFVQASFQGANANTTDEVMIVNNNDRYDNTKVDLSFGASNITVTNNTGASLPAGSEILLQLPRGNRVPYTGPVSAAITAPTGGGTVDAESRAAIVSLIAALKAAGITL